MLESVPVTLIIGTILGFLSGLGVGGGSLLILWLTVVLRMDPLTARSINLLFFLPSALISCIIRKNQGRLNIKLLLPAILAGSSCAAVFTSLSGKLNEQTLKQCFGLVLLVTGIRELLYRPRKAR